MNDKQIEELTRAYDLLRETNERLYNSMKAFQIAAEESGSLVFTYNTRTQTIFVDERTAEAFGVSTLQPGVPYDMVRQGVVTPDTQEEYIRIHEAMIQGAREAEGIVKLVQTDGTAAVNELKFRAILTEEGEPTGTAVGIYRNITERYIKDIEQECYQQAMHSVRLYTYQYDIAEDELVVFSPPDSEGTAEVAQRCSRFHERMKKGEICPASDVRVLEELLEHGAQVPVQAQLYDSPAGQKHWYGITATVQPSGRQVFGTISDIQELKAEEASYRRLERVIQSMKDEYIGIMSVDLDRDAYEFLSYNPGDTYSMDERGSYTAAVNQAADYLVAPEYREEFVKFAGISSLKEALTHESRIEFEFMTVLGSKSWQRSVFKAAEYRVLDGVKIPSKVILYMMDIDQQKTERLRQQQAITEAYRYAESANEAKTHFLSRMSHDIRTPMNAIIGMTAIAGTHLDNPKRVAECLGKITGASRHLLSLINEVLDMSKIESGTMELQEEEFNLADLIDDMVAMILPQIQEHDHRLHVNIESLLHENVIGDSLRIQQAFVNLISNGVKYTPRGGEITVSIRERSGAGGYGVYEFCFEDNGIGMSEEFQKIIFDPFTRAEDSSLGTVTGTGLGMAITRNLIRMMDGDIQVSSALGQGSRFTVTIHLKLQKDSSDQPEELRDLPVLVVDDEENVCESTCIMLDYIGMRGEWCLTGQEAVAKALERHRRDEDYFAVILDWKMPGMDGIATAREIRRQVGPDIPIIFLTAYEWSEIEQEARAAGVDRFLAKPLFKSRLLNSFKEILKREEAEPEPELEPVFSKKADFKGSRILLVEDNELNAEIACELLGMTSARIDWARDGREAVEMVERSEEDYYDMVFMDIQMPVMDGYKATAAIRSLNRRDAASLPIIAMTANAFTEDISYASGAGMNGHISKPVDIREVERTMERYLKKYR